MMLKGAKMARLGSARLGSAVVLRLLFSVSSSITLNYRVKSGSRVNYALISDFFFAGRGLAAEALRLIVRCCGCFNLFYRYTYCGNNF